MSVCSDDLFHYTEAKKNTKQARDAVSCDVPLAGVDVLEFCSNSLFRTCSNDFVTHIKNTT